MTWDPDWETAAGVGLLYPNFYNELRMAALERLYAGVVRYFSFLAAFGETYNIEPGNFLAADWLNGFGQAVFDIATDQGGFPAAGKGYENNNNIGADPPIAWTEATLLADIGDAVKYAQPSAPQIAAQYSYQLYKILNNCKTPFVSNLPTPTGYSLNTSAESVYDLDAVVDYAEWDFYTGDITINGIVRSVGSSYTPWTDNKLAFLDGTMGRCTGHAKQLKINIYAVPPSGKRYAIGNYDGPNGFKFTKLT